MSRVKSITTSHHPSPSDQLFLDLEMWDKYMCLSQFSEGDDAPFNFNVSASGADEMDYMHGSLYRQRRNGQNFACYKCGRWYSSRSIMLRHMNHECGVAKKYTCMICRKKFRRKWNLAQHLKRIHKKNSEDQNERQT